MAIPYVAPPGQPGGGDAGARALGFESYSAYQQAVDQQGGVSSGVGDIASQYIASVTAPLKKIQPYNQVDPFAFDEALAREASNKEYAPYYQEQLTNYVQKMDTTTKRSAEDLKNTLSFLSGSKDYYVGTERKLLDEAMKNSNEGFAGRGLFFSGARERDIQKLKEESGSKMSEYMRGYDYNTGQAQTANTRTGEDVALNTSLYQTDINRQQKAAIEGGVLQRKSEAVQDYEMKRNNYYENQNYLA